jgi:tetratricopeptide (TPR) repeat protein
MAVLEALTSDCGDEQVNRLAHHAIQGEVWDKALTYSRQAGAKAYAASAHREAVGYWEQALEALAHLPSDRTILEQAVDVRCDLYMALYVLLPGTQYEQLLPHLYAAALLAEELADQRRLGTVYRSLANTLRGMQDYQAALAYSQRAHALGGALGDARLQLEGNLAMGWIYYGLGDYRQAMVYLQRVLTTLQVGPGLQPFSLAPRLLGNRPSDRPIVTRIWMVLCLSELGAFADGLAYATEVLQLAETIDRPKNHVRVYSFVGRLHVRQGTLHQAIPLLERGVALSQEADMGHFYSSTVGPLALAYALAGRATDALTLLGQIEVNLLVRGEVYLLAGKVEEANRLAQCGLAHARERHMRGEEARALWLLGEIAMRRDLPDIARAEVYYHQARSLAKKQGMRPLQAHCQLGLGRLYAHRGQRQQGRVELSTAIAMYRAMDMTLWLPQAQAALELPVA